MPSDVGVWLVVRRKRISGREDPRRGARKGASIAGSDKVEYCLVLMCHQMGSPIEAISTLYGHSVRVAPAQQRRTVPPEGGNFSVDERVEVRCVL